MTGSWKGKKFSTTIPLFIASLVTVKKHKSQTWREFCSKHDAMGWLMRLIVKILHWSTLVKFRYKASVIFGCIQVKITWYLHVWLSSSTNKTRFSLGKTLGSENGLSCLVSRVDANPRLLGDRPSRSNPAVLPSWHLCFLKERWRTPSVHLFWKWSLSIASSLKRASILSAKILEVRVRD